MSKKKEKEMAKERIKFTQGCIERGIEALRQLARGGK